jgi:hypothetical protein
MSLARPGSRRGAFVAAVLTAICGLAFAAGPLFAAGSEDDEDDEEVTLPATPCARVAHEDEETPRVGALRWDVDGACLAMTGSLGISLQQLLAMRGTSARDLLRPLTAGPNAPDVPQTQPSTRGTFSFDTTRFTEIGRVSTSLGGAWTWTRGDGTSAGRFQFSEISTTIGGAKLGFILEGTRVAIAVETGTATAEAATRLVPVSFTQNPYLVLRLRHDLPNGTLHLAGAVTRNESTQFGFQTARIGFAATAGATITLAVAGRDDTLSAQVAYARDALPYLGAAVDLAGLFPRLADFGSAAGASVVMSYTRNWSDNWTSTAFVSAVAIDGIRPNAGRARSLRYGINAFWQATETLRLGAEVSMLHSRVERAPILRRFGGVTADGDAAILLVSAIVSF